MKSVIAKIRPAFLPLIKNGVKKHEYRLASPKYTSLNVDDRLILVSNQNKKDFVTTRIKKIAKFCDWESALEKYWHDDFQGLYSDWDELLKECYEFYEKDEARRYGIDVFEIVLDKPDFQNARFLLDTNIILQKESADRCCSEIDLVYQTIDKLKGIKLYHSATVKELSDSKDAQAQTALISKLNSYEKINETAIGDDYFNQINVFLNNGENGERDDAFLYSVYGGIVDFLITDDRGILQKAKEFYLQDRVLTPNHFLTKVENLNPRLIDYDALSVSLIKIGSLNVNDRFF